MSYFDSGMLAVFAVLALFLYGCASTAQTKAEDAAEQAMVDAVTNSACVGNMTIGTALVIDARDHIGTDARWSGFAIKDGSIYEVFIDWENGEEKYDYKFTYNPATKEIKSVNKEARLVLDACRSA